MPEVEGRPRRASCTKPQRSRSCATPSRRGGAKKPGEARHSPGGGGAKGEAGAVAPGGGRGTPRGSPRKAPADGEAGGRAPDRGPTGRSRRQPEGARGGAPTPRATARAPTAAADGARAQGGGGPTQKAPGRQLLPGPLHPGPGTARQRIGKGDAPQLPHRGRQLLGRLRGLPMTPGAQRPRGPSTGQLGGVTAAASSRRAPDQDARALRGPAAASIDDRQGSECDRPGSRGPGPKALRSSCRGGAPGGQSSPIVSRIACSVSRTWSTSSSS